jgi:hypothetical protein
MKSKIKLAKSVALTFVVGVLMMACSQSLQVGYDHDRTTNLKQFKSFRVEPERDVQADPLLGSDLNRSRLSDAVTEVMQAKGYVFDPNGPELVVRFMTDVKDRQQVRSNNMYSPYSWWWYGGGNNISTYSYQESRFILNIYMNGGRKMIWQGWATGKVKAPSKKEDRETMIKNTITDILRTFPQATADTYSSK